MGAQRMSSKDALGKKDTGADKAAKPLFKKTDMPSLLNDLGSIFDLDDLEIVVVRDRKCEALVANPRAEARMIAKAGNASECKTGFAKCFPELCERCPYGGKSTQTDKKTFELSDIEGRTYVARIKEITWFDGKPAAIFIFRDVSEDKPVRDRLYNLAYVDQLTSVPNRQKLREDFFAIEESIIEGQLHGVVALFDLDNFKTVNDTYGHNTGDVVLRRLTEHLEEEDVFAGHLYRLGGDEFVLLFVDKTEGEINEDRLRKHYTDILTPALRSYTLPSIEVSCTLSIGVSMFPKHGCRFSELLRKADIALYKAKASGRNKITFFEEQYDSAQKFKDLYINMQPVLSDTGKTFGYELIDRGNNAEGNGQTVSLTDSTRTLDALGLGDINNDSHYFISYSKQLLNPMVLNNLPKDKFIVQVSIPARLTKEALLNDIKIATDLKKNNYKLALTGLHSGSSATELLAVADYCKFSPLDKNTEKKKEVISANKKVMFIATDVDQRSDFEEAQETGYHLYQGFYFNQPMVGKKTKEINPMKVNYFRLLKLSSTSDYMDFREISSIISADVALSYKLLQILNSAAVGLRNVSSIANAVAYMGEESLRKWIAVLALRGIAEDQPIELVRMSLIRARFGELLTPHFQIECNPQQVFMFGMLSLLHIALEKTKEQLLEEIHVADDIRDSFLTKTGIYSDLLRFYENYEYANWEAVSAFVDEKNLEASLVSDSYIAATKWYSDLATT